MYSNSSYLPKVLFPKLPVSAMPEMEISINGIIFNVIEQQKDIVLKLMENSDIFSKVSALPSRNVIVKIRDTEYPEVSPLYLKKDMPKKCVNLKVISSKPNSTIIELWVEL